MLEEVVKIQSLTNLNSFMFRNQSIQSITRDILEQHNGRMQQSNINRQTYVLLAVLLKADITNIDMMITRADTQTLHIEKCHTSILFNRKHEWGIFSPFDEFKSYRGHIVEGGKIYSFKIYSYVDYTHR